MILTFLVKEVFQDQLKEMRDSMAECQHILDMDDESSVSTVQQVNINIRLRQIHDLAVTPQFREANSANDLREEVSDIVVAYSKVSLHFDRISKMLDRLPAQTGVLKMRRDELNRQLTDLNGDIKDTIAKNLTVNKPNVAHHILALAELIRVLCFDLDLIPLETAVIKRAEYLKGSAERLYKLCTYTYWILMAVGFVLGLGGIIYRRDNSTVIRSIRACSSQPVTHTRSMASQRRFQKGRRYS
jgi:sporulation protein YlmC with PRC-barrel domain